MTYEKKIKQICDCCLYVLALVLLAAALTGPHKRTKQADAMPKPRPLFNPCSADCGCLYEVTK
jgi:hypothetical protein